MSFETLKSAVSSFKINLFEIDVPLSADALINYEPGIWMMTLTPGAVTIEGSDGQVGYYTNVNENDYKDIPSLMVDGETYTKCTSMTSLRAQDKGFYYDKTTTRLYVHFGNFSLPLDKDVAPGHVYGFCDKVDPENGCYYNGVYYEPRIKSIPSISKSKDPLFFGLIRFQGGSVTLNNRDGYFNKIKDINLYRQPCRLKFGFAGLALDDFYTCFTGIIDKYSWNFQTCTFQIQDPRKGLSLSLPTRRFTQSEFADLDDSDVDSPKPLVYGPVKNKKLLCVNSANESASSYVFYLCDTTDHAVTQVDAVYMDGALVDASDYTVNLTAGTITIATADVSAIIDNLGNITADFTGSSITNSLAIVRDLLDIYDGKSWIPENFNQAEWNKAQAECQSTGLCIDDDITLAETIEKCCIDSDVCVFIQDDGKYTARIYDEDREIAVQIYSDEWMSDPDVSTDESKFLSSVVIKYEKDLENDKYMEYLCDAYEDEVYRRYKGKQQKTIETTLATLAGAMAKAENVMALSKIVTEQVKRKVKTQHIEREIMDFVIASPATRAGETETLAIYEIISLSKNNSAADIDLTMRFVKNYVPPAAIDYSEGALFGEQLWGENIYGVTEY